MQRVFDAELDNASVLADVVYLVVDLDAAFDRDLLSVLEEGEREGGEGGLSFGEDECDDFVRTYIEADTYLLVFD